MRKCKPPTHVEESLLCRCVCARARIKFIFEILNAPKTVFIYLQLLLWYNETKLGPVLRQGGQLQKEKNPFCVLARNIRHAMIMCETQLQEPFEIGKKLYVGLLEVINPT